MIKNSKIYLEHIIECIELIESYVKGVNFAAFEKDRSCQDAVIRRLEIIGEATKNVPQPLKEMYSEVDWKAVAGMRDIMIHRYYEVSLHIIWNVIKKDLKILKKQIKKIIAKS